MRNRAVTKVIPYFLTKKQIVKYLMYQISPLLSHERKLKCTEEGGNYVHLSMIEQCDLTELNKIITLSKFIKAVKILNISMII
jgi:hypothetical protein